MDPSAAESLESEIRKESLRNNPFPGLRPFTIDECHLYFGREYQVDEVLMKLVENQFVTVLGFSGSGKSSLMYCGVLPVLLGGFMTEAGASWNIVTTRPGISPIDNLAAAILENDPEYQKATEEEQLINRTITASILRSGPTGLVDLAKKYNLITGSNLLIHLDQFEELFRYRSDDNIHESHDEASLFVNFIIEAARQKEVPIYIAVTMRSDYIGECSHFAGLTELTGLKAFSRLRIEHLPCIWNVIAKDAESSSIFHICTSLSPSLKRIAKSQSSIGFPDNS